MNTLTPNSRNSTRLMQKRGSAKKERYPGPPGWGTGVWLTSSAPKNSSVLTPQQWEGHDLKTGRSAIQDGGGEVLLYQC